MVSKMQKFIMVDNLLTTKECQYCIDFFNKEGDLPEWRDTFPKNIDGILQLKHITNKLVTFAKNNFDFPLEYGWAEIVKWGTGSKQPAHYDNNDVRTDFRTVLTSITYLNDNFDGGHTFLSNEFEVIPKAGRTIFFDGKYFLHGVTPVTKNVRYTLPIWYDGG
jgi:hypothetical protein